jgi:hypothetical protein
MRPLSIFPLPDPESREARAFRAWRYWETNVCGSAVAALGALVIFCIVGGILLWGAQSGEGRLGGAGMILFAIAAAFALLQGNLASFWPYAVEIQNSEGLWVYAPFKRFYVPIEEVKRVKWSWLWAGWVIKLGKRHGLLTCFIIHAAWGRQGRELAQAIGEELARKA